MPCPPANPCPTCLAASLSRRAVACRGWRRMDGMLAFGEGCCRRCFDDVALPMGWRGPLRIVLVEGPWAYLDAEREYVVTRAALPDLSDPATLGCLLALVREAWSDPTLCVVLDTSDGRWHVGCWDDGMAMRGSGGATEAEALVAALESAP